jgi:long-subunit acyl-CoA synthetase (AMP-forming)
MGFDKWWFKTVAKRENFDEALHRPWARMAWQEMEGRVGELEAALEKYGWHKKDCASLINIGSRHYPKYGDCDCGLEALKGK